MNKSINIFITGTDTNVGKTYISIALLRKFNSYGFTTLGLKPIATGCHKINNTLYNDDALLLQMASSIKLDYQFINPFRFEPAIAPHIAADQENVNLSIDVVISALQPVLDTLANIGIIEGAGGVFVPINDKELLIDLIKSLNMPTIVVVGIKLGCINHAMLTINALKQKNIPLIGWVANCIDPGTEAIHENIRTLKQWIEEPCLGATPYGENPESYLDIKLILDYFAVELCR